MKQVNAVVDYYFKIPIDHVTINLEGNCTGHVEYVKGWQEEQLRKNDEGNSSLEMLNVYLGLEKYCGGAAEAKFLGRKNLDGNRSDRAVMELSVRLFNLKDIAEKIIKEYEDKAERVMDDPDIWRAVQSVASALIERKTLSQSEVKAICDRIFNKT
jgi:hypothetical protein